MQRHQRPDEAGIGVEDAHAVTTRAPGELPAGLVRAFHQHFLDGAHQRGVAALGVRAEHRQQGLVAGFLHLLRHLTFHRRSGRAGADGVFEDVSHEEFLKDEFAKEKLILGVDTMKLQGGVVPTNDTGELVELSKLLPWFGDALISCPRYIQYPFIPLPPELSIPSVHEKYGESSLVQGEFKSELTYSFDCPIFLLNFATLA